MLLTDWYLDDVAWAEKNGIMAGVTKVEFAPNEPLTRGMLAAIIGRSEGVSSQDGETGFTDVRENAYYAPHIAWAAENGILSGMGNGTYLPEDGITREQMAVALMKYAEYKGEEITAGKYDYTDADKISHWAAESVAYCAAAGLMFGRADGTFDPHTELTRAECAAIMRRMDLKSRH